MKGYLPMVELLVDQGARIDAQNETGMTALMYAAMFGHRQIVQFLVDKRAEITLRDAEGMTAGDYAAAKGFNEISVMIQN